VASNTFSTNTGARRLNINLSIWELETVRIVNLIQLAGFAPASFNAAIHDRFNVVRLGLNYHF
jgi:hypothetical protein